MAVDGRTGVLACAIAGLLAGCLDGPASDDSGGSTTTTGASTGPVGSSSGVDTSIETSTSSTSMSTTPGTTTPAPSCSDGQKNGDETDLDCGGSCPGCSEGQACIDPDDCASGLCGAGVCIGQECRSDDDCGALSGPCTRGACEPDTHTCVSAPDHEGEACDDDDLCTVGDVCADGACTPGPLLDCSEFDTACTIGQCDPGTGSCGAVDAPDDTICDDGDGCTFNEACSQGACVAPPAEGAIFYADFSAPGGWTLQAPWEIGPAAASPLGAGGADPAEDHTDTDDNGVAGTAIGGLDPLASHPYVCLTSPPIDTTQVAGTLWLSFWRHLHAPPTPGVTSKIEVFNGLAWKLIHSGYPATVDDLGWSFQKFNITGNAAVDFKVRFCLERQAGSPDFAGWSIDDVTIAPAACTP